MACAFKACLLEKDSNGGSNGEHVEEQVQTLKTYLNKLSRMVTYYDELPPIKPNYTLTTCSFEITRQTENMSPLPEYLWPA